MGAPAARVSELSRHWVEAGHEVTVLTGFPNHPDGVLRPEYRRAFRRGFMREELNGIEVVRTFLLPFPNRKPHERILNYSSFCFSAALAGSFLSRPDVVIATSPQLLVGLSGWWISRLKNVPFVLEVRDLWPESLTAVGVGGEQSLMHRAIGRIASFLYRACHHVAVVTPAFREHLIRNWNVSEGKISVVQNGVETSLFSPANSGASIRRDLGAEQKFIVSYIGTMGLAHGLETLIQSAQQLQSVAPDVLFMIVGEGADRARIESLIAEANLTNVRLIPQQPREKIPAYINASDACAVLLKKSDVFETVIPTKMLEFMSCARPVILGVKGQAEQILNSARAGLAIEPGNAGALSQAIMKLRNNPALSTDLGRNGRDFIVHNLSRRSTALHYLDVLRSLLEGNAEMERAVAA
jgi:glycosyltransferase involved in cell wall biosynthesis